MERESLPLTPPEPIAEVLRQGGVVFLPTDTLYGLSAGAFHGDALHRIANLKGRSSPFLLLCDNREKLSPLISALPSALDRLWGRVVPGPLTLLIPSRRPLPLLTGPEGKIAVRWPNHQPLKELLSLLPFPIVSTSANPHGLPPAGSVREAAAYFPEGIDLFVEDGPRGALPSTMVDLSLPVPRIVRPGSLSREELLPFLPGLL